MYEGATPPSVYLSIYPLDILNQRPSPSPYHNRHHIGQHNNNSATKSFRPQEQLFVNCYGPDEVNAPLSPLYQRNVTMNSGGVGAYMQVPSFVTTSGNGNSMNHYQQFGYRNDVQPHYVSSRNLHPSVSPIKKQMRNVGVQMGEPLVSQLEIGSNSVPMPCMTFESQVCTPRQQQRIFYPNNHGYSITPSQTNVFQNDTSSQQLSPQQMNNNDNNRHTTCSNSDNGTIKDCPTSPRDQNNAQWLSSPLTTTKQEHDPSSTQQEGANRNQLNDLTVLPPPTRYRDTEFKSSRTFPKTSNSNKNSLINVNDDICTLTMNNEDYRSDVPPTADLKHNRCVWKNII